MGMLIMGKSNIIYTGVRCSRIRDKKIPTLHSIMNLFNYNLLESDNFLNSLLDGTNKQQITEGIYLELNKLLIGLDYQTKETVSQEEALYGEYQIDQSRLDMAKKWYNKQTPEIQSFVDILVRNGEIVDITKPIDWVKEVGYKYPDTEFEYPTDLKDAIIGINGGKKVFILSKAKAIEIYMKRDGMEFDEALEMLEYNPVRATPYMNSPIIWVDDIND